LKRRGFSKCHFPRFFGGEQKSEKFLKYFERSERLNVLSLCKQQAIALSCKGVTAQLSDNSTGVGEKDNFGRRGRDSPAAFFVPQKRAVSALRINLKIL
jgi:hypothetical protein